MKNHFQIIGNIGSNISMNNPDDSDAKAHTILSIASNNNWKDKEGNWQTNVHWNDVIFFGEIAERVQQKMEVGHLILVEGTMNKVEYTDKEGIARRNTSLIGRSIKLLKSPGIVKSKEEVIAVPEQSETANMQGL